MSVRSASRQQRLMGGSPSVDAENSHQLSRSEGRFTDVAFGLDIINTWQTESPYPEELITGETLESGCLYVCNRCFKYSSDPSEYAAHLSLCSVPVPGMKVYNEVFNNTEYAIYEVDGKLEKEFCQCLSLFAKLFLDVKAVFYDVEGFFFYLLVETKSSQVAGFFSKEKLSWDDNNLACILVLPTFQRRGLGKLLIQFSYEISKAVQQVGSPETPLSDLGKRGYLSYWVDAVSECLDSKPAGSSLSVTDISRETCIHPRDVKEALREIQAIQSTGSGYNLVRRR